MSDFEELLRGIDAEAQAEGPSGVADLASLRARYDLAVQLLERRRELGMTQKELAAASGLDQAVISRIEQGNANPTVKTLFALARALHTEIKVAAAG